MPLFSTGKEALPLARLAVGNDLELGRRLAARRTNLRGLALEELLTQERLRADEAGRVFAPVLESGLGDAQDDDRLARIV